MSKRSARFDRQRAERPNGRPLYPQPVLQPAGADTPPAIRRSLSLPVLLLIAANVLLLLLCGAIGPLDMSAHMRGAPWNWSLWSHPIWHMRMLRLLTAATVGAHLALAGAGLQGLLRNPLADPYLLGVSSGAGIGVRAGLALSACCASGAGWLTTPTLAFAGALVACAVVYALAQQRGRLDPYALILSGVIVNVFNGALMMALHAFVNPFRVDAFARWSMGEIPDVVSPALLLFGMGVALLGGRLLMRRGGALNLMALGGETAHSGGVRVGRLTIEVFVLCGLMTACAVALAGPIGFVGLMVPHLARMWQGGDQRRAILFSGLLGAPLLVLADTTCRLLAPIFALGRLPVGVLTALLGGPFFLALMRRRPRGAAS